MSRLRHCSRVACPARETAGGSSHRQTQAAWRNYSSNRDKADGSQIGLQTRVVFAQGDATPTNVVWPGIRSRRAMFLLFSNRLGCVGSLVVSALLSLCLVLLLRSCATVW